MFQPKVLKSLIKQRVNYRALQFKFLDLAVCPNLPSVLFLSPTSNVYTSPLTSNYKHARIELRPTELHEKSVSEKEFFVQISNDPDTFGSAADKDEQIEEDEAGEDHFREEKPLGLKKLRTKQYADIIKDYISKRRIKEAIDVLETRMLKEDNAKPESYIYNLLLGACGKVGYTKKAFSLYNQMKKRGLLATGGTYTALFNACANSPWPTTDGLTRAKHLHELMIEKMYEPNHTNYNAMIKAFGRCGDLPMAFRLVDEMVAKKLYIDNDTLNFLLQACISDSDAGFRHSLLVWRKFIDKHIAPNLFSYNLMLRSIRDCGIGDIETTKDVINQLLPDNDKFFLNEPKNQLASSENINCNKIYENITEADSSSNIKMETKIIKQCTSNNSILVAPVLNLKKTDNFIESGHIPENKPNLMAKIPALGNILSLSEVRKPEDKLLLVGGLSGFLANMKENNCRPNIKTFTELLDCIPSTLAAENELLRMIKKCDVKKDVDFFNMLIKKRSMRFDYEAARVS